MSRARNVADIMSGVGSNVVFEDGFGLDFGAVAGGGATSSVLDDYEEGIWTPGVVSGGLDQLQDQRYVKIGSLVRVVGGFRLSDQSTSNPVEITGLPYAVLDFFNDKGFAARHEFASFAYQRVNVGSNSWCYAHGANSLRFAKGDNSGGNNAELLHSDANSYNLFRISFWYRTND